MPAHVSRRRSLLVTAAALAGGPLLVMSAARATSPLRSDQDRAPRPRVRYQRLHLHSDDTGMHRLHHRGRYGRDSVRVAPRDDRHRRRLRLKSIAFQVNGHTVKKLTHPKRGALVKLAAPDNLPITVTAKVKLRTGKTATSSASYLQCS